MNTRKPAALTAIGVVATLVLAVAVVIALLSTSGAQAVSDNAALIGALVALGGVLTAQMVSIALDNRRTHEAALKQYLERVGSLLIEKPLRQARPDENLRTEVRAQTLAVLHGLGPTHKRILLQFLYESGMIHKDKPVVSLASANLRGADLREANLRGANLSWADLYKADLRGANLNDADLSDAFLRRAKLSWAELHWANLSGANLRWANLKSADLYGANLSHAYLGRTLLRDVGLSEADLRGTGITNEELERKSALYGAIMPDGSKHP